MAKTTKKETIDKNSEELAKAKNSWRVTRQHKLLLGSMLVLFSIALFVAFVSFFVYDLQVMRVKTEHNNLSCEWEQIPFHLAPNACKGNDTA